MKRPEPSSSTPAAHSAGRAAPAGTRRASPPATAGAGADGVAGLVAQPAQPRPVARRAAVVDEAHQPVEVGAVDQPVEHVVAPRSHAAITPAATGSRPPLSSPGSDAVLGEPRRPPLHRLDLVGASSSAMSAGTPRHTSCDGVELRRRQRLAGELPDHRAQLEVGREAQPVVDRPHPVAGEQAVAALAVGVVGDDVEHGDVAQLVVQVRALLGDREVVLAVVGVDEPLQRALAERAVVAQHRRRDDAEAHRLAQPVRGDLPPVQAGLEVPQRALAAHRLVDRLGAGVPEAGEERGVARPRHPALERRSRPRRGCRARRPGTRAPRRQFIRGHG